MNYSSSAAIISLTKSQFYECYRGSGWPSFPSCVAVCLELAAAFICCQLLYVLTKYYAILTVYKRQLQTSLFLLQTVHACVYLVVSVGTIQYRHCLASSGGLFVCLVRPVFRLWSVLKNRPIKRLSEQYAGLIEFLDSDLDHIFISAM